MGGWGVCSPFKRCSVWLQATNLAANGWKRGCRTGLRLHSSRTFQVGGDVARIFWWLEASERIGCRFNTQAGLYGMVYIVRVQSRCLLLCALAAGKRLGLAGAFTLARMLEHNPTLTTLDLTGTYK